MCFNPELLCFSSLKLMLNLIWSLVPVKVSEFIVMVIV